MIRAESPRNGTKGMLFDSHTAKDLTPQANSHNRAVHMSIRNTTGARSNSFIGMIS